MTETINPIGKPSLRAILKEAWLLFLKHKWIFLSFALLQNLYALSNSIFDLSPANIIFRTLYIVLWSLAETWFRASFMIAISRAYHGTPLGLIQALVAVRGRFLRFLGVEILYGLIIAGGLFLLILPGIYWGIVFIFASLTVLLEDKAVKPFKHSRSITKRFFWLVFFFLALALLPVLFWLPMAAISRTGPLNLWRITGFFVGVFVSVYFTPVLVILYHKLVNYRQANPEDDAKIRKGFLGFLAKLAIVIASLVAIAVTFYGCSVFTRALSNGKSPAKTQIRNLVVSFIKMNEKNGALPDGSTFQVPAPWFTLQQRQKRRGEPGNALVMMRIEEDRFNLVWFWWLPAKDKNGAAFDDAQIAENIRKTLGEQDYAFSTALQEQTGAAQTAIVRIGAENWKTLEMMKPAIKSWWIDASRHYFKAWGDHVLILSYFGYYQSAQNKSYKSDAEEMTEFMREFQRTLPATPRDAGHSKGAV